MRLADTSIWIAHFRMPNPLLENLLGKGMILMHPFVLGEIVCGNLRQRSSTLANLARLPISAVAEHSEALSLIEQGALSGRGIGFVDVHLLASAKLSNCRIWTIDRALLQAAIELDLAAE